MLPSDITPEQLSEIASNNLVNKISYKTCESKEKGIFGIFAGGDFEAESILMVDIWEKLAIELNDDIIISIPTKDIVFYTNLSNKKLRNKMFKMARKIFNKSLKEEPELVFCKDIFVYSRNNNNISVSNKYNL